MIGPVDIEAWAEEAETSETVTERETPARSQPHPSPFALLSPMAASLAMPWRLAFERLPTHRRAG